MSRITSSILPIVLALLVLGVVGTAIGFVLSASTADLPSGPVDLVWDKTACVACGMHVGEPPFAAQLTTKDGRTVAFDDPGCLFLYVEEQRPDVHSIYFHHHQQARWIAAENVAFALLEVTPMGFGIGAVDKGTPQSIDYAEARKRCLDRTSGHGGR